MARRTATKAADTDVHGTGKPDALPAEGATTVPVTPYPGIYPGHPDATYCPDCGRTAVGRMVHGEHPKAKR